MSIIDNSFASKFTEYKSKVSAQTITPDEAQSLKKDILADGKIDQDEQKALHSIGEAIYDVDFARKFASSIDPTNSGISALIMRGFESKAQVTKSPTLDVSKMDNKEKIIEAIKGSLKYVAPELRAKIEAILTTENINKMSAVLIAYLAAHAVGVAEIADGALFLVGGIALGSDLIDVLKKLYEFSTGAVDAKTPQELDQASRQLGSAMATIASDIPALIGMKNTRPAVGNISYPTIKMRPVMSENGVAILVPSRSWATATVQGAQISRTNAAAIGSTTMMSVASNGTGGSEPRKRDIPSEYNNVPSKIRGAEPGTIDVSKFSQRARGGDLVDPKTGYRLSPERAKNSGTGGHGGSYWKLLDAQGNRVGTIAQDGKFLRG